MTMECGQEREEGSRTETQTETKKGLSEECTRAPHFCLDTPNGCLSMKRAARSSRLAADSQPCTIPVGCHTFSRPFSCSLTNRQSAFLPPLENG